MKTLYAVVLAVLFAMTARAVAQQYVDQGAPGTQGPWPVTISGSGGGSGGLTAATYPQPCSSYVETNVSVSTSSTLVPASSTASRVWVRICNSLLNTEGAQCVCSATGVPTYAAASNGDQLAVSDCVLYNLAAASTPRCICNGAGVRLTTAECVQP